MADTPSPPIPSPTPLTCPPSPPRSRSPPLPRSASGSNSNSFGVGSRARSATNETSSRRRSLPFIFPPLFPKDTSSTFLVPNTAEGRPIPLDGSTAAHRTTALRQLNRSQPSSRHRYTRSSGSPNIKGTTTETYSQPVVVRTYSGLPPSSSARGPVSVSTVSPTPDASSQQPQHPSRSGTVINIMRYKKNEKARPTAGAKLPPLEAFTFKSIMADIGQDVSADLDRIAEICARSKYSLSNQYEVHIAPQGSGAGFPRPPSASMPHVPVGPTLQAISSDDEHGGPVQKKRRNIARRRSVAYGTLETIMSSSRSSDEDKCKKKPAADIIEEVRGRAAKGTKGENASVDGTEAQANIEQQGHSPSMSTLFATAIIDSSMNQIQGNNTSPETSAGILSSRPAKPQTSRNYLQTRTSPEGSIAKQDHYTHEPLPRPSRAVAWESTGAATISPPKEPRSLSGSSFSAWISWGAGAATEVNPLDPDKLKGYSSYAEGSLKELLRSVRPLKDKRYKSLKM
ncbi:hypothetical protein F4819DRAFT_446922 [Hypoxylon fuscum]|nr:hypothetical protein F4819DRAFT_446922 [Hypoxylon fuscum]